MQAQSLMTLGAGFTPCTGLQTMKAPAQGDSLSPKLRSARSLMATGLREVGYPMPVTSGRGTSLDGGEWDG